MDPWPSVLTDGPLGGHHAVALVLFEVPGLGAVVAVRPAAWWTFASRPLRVPSYGQEGVQSYPWPVILFSAFLSIH